jgi:hypothetical protein
VSPILGIYASQISGHLYANSYDALGVVTVGSGGAVSISFTGIPSTYQHLQIRGIVRSSSGSVGDSEYLVINSDSSSNYSFHNLRGDGSGAYASGSTSQTALELTQVPGGGATSNSFGALVIDILDYANTNKYKTIRSLGGWENNGTYSQMSLRSGLWMSTSAITSLTLSGGGGSAQYSSFALYGIK